MPDESTGQETVQLLREILNELVVVVGRLDAFLLVQIETSNTLSAFLADWQAANTPVSAGSAVISVSTKGSTMSFNVDDTTGNAVLGFEDDHGDPVGPPPGDGSGLVVTFASNDNTVCTVGTAVAGTDAAGNVNYEAPLTPVAEGSFDLSATVDNASGAPLTDADGVTPFVQPTAITVPVSAGQAASGTLAEVG